MKITVFPLIAFLFALFFYGGLAYGEDAQPFQAESAESQLAEPKSPAVVEEGTSAPEEPLVRKLEDPSAEGLAARATQRYVILIDQEGRELVSEILEVTPTSLRVRRQPDAKTVEIPFDELSREDRIFAEYLLALESEPTSATAADSVPSDAKVPYDLPHLRPILSQSRLHSPRTRGNIAVRRGQFQDYELPDRFYLGEDGKTMVLATTRRDRDRSELRHNSTWSVTEGEVAYSGRLRFDMPIPEGEGWKRRRLNIVQIYVPRIPLGPVLLISSRINHDDKEDHLWAAVQGGGGMPSYDLGPRPDGFFNLDIRINDGIVRIYINDELKHQDDFLSFEGRRAFFKTGAYHRGIEPVAIEFESLSIRTP